MKKSIISLILVLTMALGLLPVGVMASSFTDVAPGAWYEEPINWAVENNITSGVGGGRFAPGDTCTRAQVVTFLWRSQGEPAPAGNENPFTDVKEGDYFYEAVLWAVENGITTGLSATTFGPTSPCTRGQVVTFLWRAMGKPEPMGSENPFGDVKDSDYYYDAVLWAVENGITTGLNATTFGPGSPCTRGHVVTFLFRTPAPGGVTKVELNVSEVTLNYGAVYQLSATVSPEDAEDKSLVWVSSDSSIATVDSNGYVNAGTTEGSAVISAKAVNGKTAKCTVYVKDESGVTSIGFPMDTNIWMAPGQVYQQVAMLNEGAVDKNVVWTSADTDIATIEDVEIMEVGSSCNIVAGQKEGDVLITATAANGLSAQFTLHVAKNVILYKPDGMVMEVPTEGWADYVDWSIEKGSLNVEDSGSMDNYDWIYGESYLYLGGVGETPFYNRAGYSKHFSKIESLYIKRGMEYVGNFSFSMCGNLKHAEIPDTVDCLDSYCFDDCVLERIGIPASVTLIASTAFDTYKKPATSSNKNMVVYCESGSYAQQWAIDNGLAYVEAGMLYSGDGRTIMVSEAERALYLRSGVWFEQPVVTVYAEDGTEKQIPENELEDYLDDGWYKDKNAIMTTVYAPDGSEKQVLKIEADKLEDQGWYAYPVCYVYAADGTEKVIPKSELDAYVADGWYKDKSELYVTMYDIDGNTKEVLKVDVEKEQANGWYLYEDYQRAQIEKYTYLAGSDFRSVRRDYPHAVAKGGYVIGYTDSNGDYCVLTYVVYSIVSDYSITTLHNITQGKTIKNPADYYEKQADRSWGATKIKYMNLKTEVLEAENNAINGFKQGIIDGSSTGKGAFVSARTLNM